MTPEGTLMANFTTLINILTGAKGSWSVASSARAKEPTMGVCAGTIAAQAAVFIALILIYALSP